MGLKDLQDETARLAFGMTKDEALAKGICICCKQPPALNTSIAKREYRMSGLCERCFDEIVGKGDE